MDKKTKFNIWYALFAILAFTVIPGLFNALN